jgi:LmbE family N-acetylglucosaminyl deacetylase
MLRVTFWIIYRKGYGMAIHTHYDAIYLSPHLDDAALSCGGQIYAATQAGARVLIVTITAGDPVAPVSTYAASLHARWELIDATEARRQEDMAACAILGAEPHHWDVPDCIYRVDEDGAPFYLSDADIFGAVAPAEMALVARLAEQMRALPRAMQVLVPLTVGHHVDHQLVRLAAEEAFDPATLLYYEDYPYAQQPESVAQTLAQTDGRSDARWVERVVALDNSALAAKYEAIATFCSQLSTFFRDRADLEAQVGGYARSVGGERQWRRLPVIE